jgi:4-carboxymuconolactone decarboxylase
MTEDIKKVKVYEKVSKNFPDIFSAVNTLGETIRSSGPLDKKTTQLIQLAAAAAGQSEGSVHSHTKRALEAGASREEIEHCLLLLISVIGFPNTAAALSWTYDVIENA